MKRKPTKGTPAVPSPAVKGTIRWVIERAILAGKGTVGVLAAVKRSFPHSKTSPACVAFYRTNMRHQGLRVPKGAA